MNEIQCKSQVNEIFSLDTQQQLGVDYLDDKNSLNQKKQFFISKILDKINQISDNTATTKLLTVKPNRHTSAIFTPSACTLTGVNTSYLDTLVSSAYGGLIEPNTTPLVGNKFSRLVAVVETCQPYLGLVNLTKLLGVFA